MNKLLFLSLLFANLSNLLCAQTNVYFQNNPVWMVEHRDFPGSSCSGTQFDINYVVQGDTIINSLTYKKVKESQYLTYFSSNCTPIANSTTIYPQPTFFLRSDNRQMFVRFPADTAEYLLYDFNLSLGDTLPQTYTNNPAQISGLVYTVVSIDSFLTPNGYMRSFALQGGLGDDTLFEGIGSTGGLIESIYPLLLSGYHYLRCYSMNGNGIWPVTQTGSCDLQLGIQQQIAEREKVAVYPQPFTTQTQIRLPQSVSRAVFNVYAFDGSCVHTEQVSGAQIEFRNENLTPGVYCFRVVTSMQVYSGRLVITGE